MLNSLIKRIVITAVLGIQMAAVHAQQTTPQQILQHAQQTGEKLVFTDTQLTEKGLSLAEITEYRMLMEGQAGQWWGHLDPQLFLAFATTEQSQRNYYVNRYLRNNFPRANAERQTMIAFRQEAKKLAPTLVQQAVQQIQAKSNNQIFINLDCDSCANEIKQLIKNHEGKTDLYFIGAENDSDILKWAETHQLPPNKITLNHNNGLYEKYFKQPLSTYSVYTP